MPRDLLALGVVLSLAVPARALQLPDLQPGRNFVAEANFGTSDSEELDFGDCDNDGDMDVVVGNGGEDGPQLSRLFINNGGLQGGTVGTFTEETLTRLAGVPAAHTRDIEFVDIDNDEDLDICVGNRGTGAGGGATGEATYFFVNLGGLQGGTIGYFQDETETRWGTLVSVPLGEETGVQDGQGPFREFTCDCDFADLDDDGWQDLFHTSYGPGINGTHPSRIFLNDATGVFDELWPWCAGTQGSTMDIQAHTLDADLVDLDGDLDIDIVMSSRQSQARVYLNNLHEGISASPFNDITQFALVTPGATQTGSANYEAEYGDVDGDQDFDIWMVNYVGNTDHLLRNEGFTPGSGVSFTKAAGWIKNDPVVDENEADFLDFDGDGDLDTFMANFSGTNHLYVSGLAQGLNPATTGLFHRAGISTLYPQGELPTGTPGGLVTLDGETADVDNDGDPDLAVANSGGQQNYLYRNLLGVPDTHAPTFFRVTDQADQPTGVPTVIHAQIRDNAADYMTTFHEADLVYAVNGGAPQAVDMFAQGSMQFRAVIPAQVDALVTYHVEVTDLAGNTGVSATFDYVQGTPSSGPWTDLGGGLVGASGIPVLAGTGTLVGGTPGALELTSAAPLASSILFISFANNPTPFKGGTLSTVPVAVQLGLATNGGGGWSLPWGAYPAGVPSGFELFYQAATADGGATKGASISNLLRSTAP